LGHCASIEAVRTYYDALGKKEWDRLAATVHGRVSLEVHRRFLRRLVRPGSRVLEVGAGPGRFTFELAAIGAKIVVTDVSEVQLRLNEARLRRTDAERCVERRELFDVCDASRYADGQFDAVVAFGGPLSYAFERTDEAMGGLLRVIRPDGFVTASVMSCSAPGATSSQRLQASPRSLGRTRTTKSCAPATFAMWSATPVTTSAGCSAGATSKRWLSAPVAG
jgi:ubiquinone/menaquinone biosynthesis C-methylase UbiE